MGLNKAMVIGYLGRDVEPRFLPSGTKVAAFSVASDESYTDKKTGERVKETEWHNIKCFGKLAETCEKYLAKGRQVYVEGRLRREEWDAKDGSGKGHRTFIIANKVQFIGSRPDGIPPEHESVQGDEDIPF